MIKNQGERWWNKVEQRHERSGIGNLVRPEDILPLAVGPRRPSAQVLGARTRSARLVDILDADRSDLSEVDFATRPTQRFHGSIPHCRCDPQPHQQDARILIAGAQSRRSRTPGWVAAGVSRALSPRVAHAGAWVVYCLFRVELSLRAICALPLSSRLPLPTACRFSNLKDADGRATARQLILLWRAGLVDDADVQARSGYAQLKSKTSAFVSDFRDLTVGDYVVHGCRSTALARCTGGMRGHRRDMIRPPLELMILEFC